MGKTKKALYYALAFIMPLALATILIYKMNEITLMDLVLKNAGIVTGSVIKQAAFIFAIEIYGLAVMFAFNRFFSRMKIIMMSFIAGALLWSLSSVVIVCIGVPFKWYYIATLCILILVAVHFALKPAKLSKQDAKFYLLTIVLYASFAVFFASLCVFRFSYDSYMYINTGQKIAKLGYLSKDLVNIVSGFSLFTPMLFAPSEFFGFDFSQGLYLLLNVQFTVFVGYVIYEKLRTKVSFRKSVAFGAFAFLALVSSNIYFELMYWPMSNLLTAMTMFGFLYFAHEANAANQRENMLLSAFFAICFVLIRSENMLLYICFMFIITLSEIDRKSLALHIASVALALVLWYARFFFTAGIDFAEGAFLTINRAFGVLAVLVLFIGYVIFLSKSGFIEKRKRFIEKIFFAALILAIAGLSVLEPSHFIENMKSTVYNVFYDGAWSGALVTISVIYFFKLYTQKGFDFYDKQLLVFLLFYFIIFQLRSMPLRIGFGDSGSRYFAHLLPLVVYNSAYSFGSKAK